MSSGGGMPEKAKLRRVLGFWDLVLFGLICIAPVAPFTLYGFVAGAGGAAVVPPYLLGAIGLGFTSLSYAAMAEVAPQAGSTYGFARAAMGPFAGFVAGWAILLDYAVVGALVLLYGALYLSPLVSAVPTEGLIVAIAVLTLTINFLGITWSAWVNIFLTGLQFAVAFVAVVAALVLLTTPGGGGLTLDPLWNTESSLAGVLAATPLAVIAFLGFDAVSTLSEEVRGDRPGVVVGRATLTALGLMLTLMVAVSWLLTDLSRGMAAGDPGMVGMEIVMARIAWLAVPLEVVVALAYGVGLVPAVHVGVSRLAFAMARNGDLPRVLAYVHPGRQVPVVAVVLFGALFFGIALVALPHVDLLGALVSFGAISGFILVNLAVIVHFGVRGRSRRWVRHWISPALGILVLIWVLTGVAPQALWLGFAWLAIGLVWYLARRLLVRPRTATT